MAADIEAELSEASDLIQSSGGVFEVERDGTLIFSKKATSRFPVDGEVLSICRSIDKGVPLAQAQIDAGKNAPKTPSFTQWLGAMFNKR